MAIMIPPTLDDSVTSNAERKIFQWLQKLNWKSCVVLHSLGLSEHVNNIFGEIDFVVISTEGILCIEVKGGIVYREDGLWHFVNRYGRNNVKNQGPFMQAEGNMQSLRQYLRKRLDKKDPLVRCQYACCVMTPDCRLNAIGPDVIPEVLFDSDSDENELGDFFDSSFQYWSDELESKHGFRGGLLSQGDVSRAVDLLRGDFRFVPSISSIINRINRQLTSLTDEQYLLLENLDVNERLMVSGAAGTGKTLMAIEQCRRETAAGLKVLYLCFNHMIAAYVRRLTDAEGNPWDVYTLHSIMKMMVGKMDSATISSEIFVSELPEHFIEHMSSETEWKPYDVVIIDEGQDLMNKRYMECIDKLVLGGIENGRWTIFYDPQQNLFQTDAEFNEVQQKLVNISAGFRLSINCRNTKQIAFANQAISNFRQGRILKAEGIVPTYNCYKTLIEERDKIIDVIRSLRTQGVRLKDMVLLSPYAHTNSKSCLYGMEFPQDIGFLRYNEQPEKAHGPYLNAYTIQSFKGMEADVVLLIDIDEFQDTDRRLLNYVAISRARAMLFVFYDSDKEQQRQEMLLQGMLMEQSR
jgi:Holliday junction resolvase-like predicted endonuclease